MPDSWLDVLAGIYDRPQDEQVMVTHGNGVKMRVRDDRLVISDGTGRYQRERQIGKVDRELQRIIITGQTGYVTLEALRWCAEHGISVVTLDLNSDLISHYAPDTTIHNPDVVRHQVHATGTVKELEIVREIESRKLTGQADNCLKLFGNTRMAEMIASYRDRVSAAETVKHMLELEGWAARDYFSAWTDSVAVNWDAPSVARVPVNWLGYQSRGTLTNKSKDRRNASDPVNALLNYAYTLGYAECRIACVAYGLDPRLGYLHADKTGRDSLALDVLETIRPAIDAYIVSLIRSRVFSYQHFTEPYGFPPGTCRMVAPLTHEIAEASYAWHKPAGETVKTIVSILTGHGGRRGDAIHNVMREKLAFTSAVVTADEILPDKLWAEFDSLIPPWPGQVSRRPPISDRTLVAAMLYMTRERRPWAHVPRSLGVSFRTMNDRRRMWQRSGHWDEIERKIRELEEICDTSRETRQHLAP